MKNFLLFLLFLGVLTGVFFYLFRVNRVSGDSMAPTLANGKLVVFWQFGEMTTYLRQGSIIIYKPPITWSIDSLPGTYDNQIGRVVGMPGNKMKIQGGRIYNKTPLKEYPLDENYLPAGTKTASFREGDYFDVPENQYFVLPDKRVGVFSVEAHFVPKENIVGLQVWHF